MPRPTSTPSGPVLVVSSDERVVQAATTVCATAGTSPVLVRQEVDARRAWASAGSVVVGGDAVAALATDPPPRRDGVVVLHPRPAEAWQEALVLRAELVVDPGDPDGLAAAVDLLRSRREGGAESCVVAVVGGAGGVGASTVAAVLATEAHRRGLAAVLVDADPWGGGLDLLLGVEDVGGVRWADLDQTRGRLDAVSLRDALPSRAGPGVLSFDRRAALAFDAASARAVVTAAARASDVVVVDLPRRDDAVTEAVLSVATLVVVVVPAQVRALAAARDTTRAVRRLAERVVAVLRGPAADLALTAEVLDVPVVTRWRDDRTVAADVALGRGPGRSRACRRAAADVLALVGLDVDERAAG